MNTPVTATLEVSVQRDSVPDRPDDVSRGHFYQVSYALSGGEVRQ